MIKYIDFFCGCGGMGLGFKQAHYETVGAFDFDKYAVQSYSHNVDNIVKQADISKQHGEDLPTADVWSYGSPCQDISIAGKQKGLVDGKRSSMFFEVMRLLGEVKAKPKVIVMENVKALKKYLPIVIDQYDKNGYRAYYKVYNSKYFDVPQNRERYFVVGIRKDIKKDFVFPEQPKTINKRLVDILEKNVDEKYYYPDEKAQKLIEKAIKNAKIQGTYDELCKILGLGNINGINRTLRIGGKGSISKKHNYEYFIEPKIQKVGNVNPTGRGINGEVIYVNGLSRILTTNKGEGYKILEPKILRGERTKEAKEKRKEYEKKEVSMKRKDMKCMMPRPDDVSNTLTTIQKDNLLLEPKINIVGNIDINGHDIIKRVYSINGISPTLTAIEGGNQQAKILVPVAEATKAGYAIAEIGDSINISHPNSKTRIGRIGHEIAQTLLTGSEQVIIDPTQYRIRKLTPKEYGRLQGFPETWEQVVSNTQAYKQFGNAVTVTVAKTIADAIRQQIFEDIEITKQKQMSIFDLINQ